MKKVLMTGLILCLGVSAAPDGGLAGPQDGTLEQLFSVASPTGYEDLLADRIQSLLPAGARAEKDNLGSLRVSQGEGDERLTVICALDEMGYIVSGVTRDGYLNLDRVVPEPHPGFDGFFFGHGLVVRTRENGLVPGVQALPSLHIFPRSRRAELESLFSLENALLDVGASSPEEVLEKGISVLDPVSPMREIVSLAGSLISGYSLGHKACLSLCLDLARGFDRGPYSLTWIWTAQTKFLRRRGRTRQAVGALAVLDRLEPSRVIVIDIYACSGGADGEISVGLGPVLADYKDSLPDGNAALTELAAAEGIPLQRVTDPPSALVAPFLEEDRLSAAIFLPVRYAATPSEIVDREDIDALARLLKAAVLGGI